MSCLDKAMYLMKFAGLSRVTWSHDDRPDSPIAKRPSWGQKSFRWQRVSSVVSTVSRIKQQVMYMCKVKILYILYCTVNQNGSVHVYSKDTVCTLVYCELNGNIHVYSKDTVRTLLYSEW